MFKALPFFLFCLLSTSVSFAAPLLTINTSKITATVSPVLYGLMTEEINHSYDGGLYGELIQNRIFRDDAIVPAHWSIVQDVDGRNSISLDEGHLVEGTALTRCLKLDAKGASTGHRVGVANDGYWGIAVRPETTYHVSFFAKSDAASSGPFIASLESRDGLIVFATGQVSKITNRWKKYTAALTTTKDVPISDSTRFVLSTVDPGVYWLNLVSLFPPTFNNRPNGNRCDIMQLLSEMKPSFLRLPGGNFLEGDTIDERFPWDKTLGPVEQRPGHRGCWNYGASDGMGLLEMLEWCEDLHTQPVLGIYAGYSLNGEHIGAGFHLRPFVDSALDEIEYITGDATTKWGAKRAQNGHPAPFSLSYIEIGNEDDRDKSHSYQGRYAQFYRAIKARFPELQCIDTCGPKYWDHFQAKIEQAPDVIDEHYYRNAFEMENDATHYDSYDRKGPKIFVGEWATREGAPTTDLNAALGDAAWMTGMERNSNIVIMASYAPLLVNVNPGGLQWKSNLIGFDALTSYGSPSYYAQKMFSNYLGDGVVSVVGENIETQTWQPRPPKAQPGEAPLPLPPSRQVPTLFYVATIDSKTGMIYLKVVNTVGKSQAVRINVTGIKSVMPEGTLITLTSASPSDTNSISQPTKVVPIALKVNGLGPTFSQTFAPYSVNVFQIRTE